MTYEKCYKSHPPLPLGEGLVIYGGSCSDPVPKDADIYVGLDWSMDSDIAPPWEGKVAYRYLINDGHAPNNPDTFDKLVRWLAAEIVAGKKVHVGCIGGHGRTGTLFAALVKVMLDEPDAITYVRDHYCKKVVESKSQVNFLAKHYGIVPVVPAKAVPEYSGLKPAVYRAPEVPWVEPAKTVKTYHSDGTVTSYDYGTSGKKTTSRNRKQVIQPANLSPKCILAPV